MIPRKSILPFKKSSYSSSLNIVNTDSFNKIWKPICQEGTGNIKQYLSENKIIFLHVLFYFT